MLKKLLKKVESLNEEQIRALYGMLLVMTDDETMYSEGLVKQPEPKKEEPPEPEKPLYERNDTMRMIGRQYLPEVEGYQEGITDIMAAYGLQSWFQNNTFELFSVTLDVFNFGVIYGKRILRQNKKATAKPTK